VKLGGVDPDLRQGTQEKEEYNDDDEEEEAERGMLKKDHSKKRRNKKKKRRSARSGYGDHEERARVSGEVKVIQCRAAQKEGQEGGAKQKRVNVRGRI